MSSGATILSGDPNDLSDIINMPKDVSTVPHDLGKVYNAWEQWLLSKETVSRANRIRERERQQEELVASEKMQHSNRVKQAVSTKAWNVRIREKRRVDEAEAYRLQQRVKEDLIVGDLQKIKNQKRCSEAYRQWLSMKLKDSSELKTKLQRQLQDSQNMDENKKVANKDAYNQWLKLAESKQCPVYRSFGISAGKLISWRT